MGRRRNTPDFNRSNRIHATRIIPTEEERSLTRKLIESDRASVREAYGQRLLNRMCERLRIPPVRLRIQDVHQPHKKRSGRLTYKEYGAYYLEEQVIVIANLTAVRGKVVAGKTFFDTLIHEFMHHLDRVLLQISSTPHSSGFYNRNEDLKRKLMGGGPAEIQAERGRWEKPPENLMAALDQAAKAARENEIEKEPEPRKNEAEENPKNCVPAKAPITETGPESTILPNQLSLNI